MPHAAHASAVHSDDSEAHRRDPSWPRVSGRGTAGEPFAFSAATL